MKKRLFYTDNEPLSAITHIIGLLLAIAGLTLLVVFASINGTVWHIVGFSIFGTTLILLYLASSWYHLVSINSKWKRIMQKIDHSMIYALIAGTYTPICLITLRGGWGWSLFGTIWALAIGGIIWKSIGGMPEKLSLTLYIVMGWLAVIAFVPLINNMPPGALIWLLAGGLSYTIGSVIYAIENKFPRRKWFCLHDLWHIFVMTGSFCHFVMFFWYLI